MAIGAAGAAWWSSQHGGEGPAALADIVAVVFTGISVSMLVTALAARTS